MSDAVLPFSPRAHASSAAATGAVPVHELELELAQAALRRAALLIEHDVEPAATLEEVARSVARALSAVYDAFDGRGDHLAGVRGAMTEIDHAAAAAGRGGAAPGCEAVIAELARARDELARAEPRLASIVPAPPVPAPDMKVSIDVPRLHLLKRPSLIPRIVAPQPPPEPPAGARHPAPRPTTFEELAALASAAKQRALAAASAAVAGPPKRPEKRATPVAVPQGFTRDVGVAIDEPLFQRARARECFEEVAMVAAGADDSHRRLRALRPPRPGAHPGGGDGSVATDRQPGIEHARALDSPVPAPELTMPSAPRRSRLPPGRIAVVLLLCGLGCARSGAPARPPLPASPELDRCVADVRAQSVTSAGCLRIVFDNALPPAFDYQLIHLWFDGQPLIPPRAPPRTGAWLAPFYVGRVRPGDHVVTAIFRVRSTELADVRLFEVRIRRGFRVTHGHPFTLRLVAYATNVDGEVGLIPAAAAQGDPSWRVSMDDIPPPTPPDRPPRLR